MKEVSLDIDGTVVKVEEGATLLQAAQSVGIEIPTLCYHERLVPYGACRLCTVEIVRGKRTQLVASCAYPAEEGLTVKTKSESVIKIRRMLLELMLPLAPAAKVLQDLAKAYGVTGPRFETEVTFCILCGLCVRYCKEVKKANAIGFVGRGTERKVAFFPEIASSACMSCRECFPLCPTAKLPSETDGVCFLGLTLEDFLSSS